MNRTLAEKYLAEAKGLASSACIDYAHDVIELNACFCSDKHLKKIQQLKREKVQDVAGCFADFLYEDGDFLFGIIADHIYMNIEDDSVKFEFLKLLSQESGTLGEIGKKLLQRENKHLLKETSTLCGKQITFDSLYELAPHNPTVNLFLQFAETVHHECLLVGLIHQLVEDNDRMTQAFIEFRKRCTCQHKEYVKTLEGEHPS